MNTINIERVDRPIDAPEQDRLGRTAFAIGLADSLQSPELPGVFAITGPWGSGKTSLANLTEKHLSGRAIVTRFEPWLVGSPEALIQELFSELATAIFGIDAKHERAAVYEYGAKLAKASSATASALALLGLPGASAIEKGLKEAGAAMDIAADALKVPESIRLQRDKIARSLPTEQLHIVLIDDVDRLTHEEIRTLFRVLKAGAVFPSLKYLVLYDPPQVEAALGYGDRELGRKYLEKIVTVPLDLPAPGRLRIANELWEILIPLRESIPIDDPWARSRFDDIFRSHLAEGFQNLREIKRYCGSLYIHARGMTDAQGPNYDLADLSLLELLRTKAPEAYGALVALEDRHKIPSIQMVDLVRAQYDKEIPAIVAIQRAVDRANDIRAKEIIEWLRPDIDLKTGTIRSSSIGRRGRRRYSSEAYRDAYLGFVSEHAVLTETQWTEFRTGVRLRSLERINWSWLNLPDTRMRVASALAERFVDLENEDLKHLIQHLAGLALESPIEHDDWLSHRRSRFSTVVELAEVSLEVYALEDDAVSLLQDIETKSHATAFVSVLVGKAQVRVSRHGLRAWATEDSLSPLIEIMKSKVITALEDGSILDFPDAEHWLQAAYWLEPGDDRTQRLNRLLENEGHFLIWAEKCWIPRLADIDFATLDQSVDPSSAVARILATASDKLSPTLLQAKQKFAAAQDEIKRRKRWMPEAYS